MENRPERRLRDGIVVRARLTLGQEDRPALPRESVIKRTGGEFVFTVTDSIAHLKPVTTGRLVENRMAFEKGLSGGELVVTAGMDNLSDGVEVVIETTLNSPPRISR